MELGQADDALAEPFFCGLAFVSDPLTVAPDAPFSEFDIQILIRLKLQRCWFGLQRSGQISGHRFLKSSKALRGADFEL